MRLGTLGRTGVEVSRIGLGTAQFGSWSGTSVEDDIRVIHAALDAGINLIDTADAYSAGEAEEIVGRALVGRRDDVVLASKFSRPVGEERPNRHGGSRRWIVRAVEDSLRRLRTDWIDLYQIHWFNHGTDLDETLGALSDLVHQGKVRMIGSSVFPAGRIVEAQWVSERRGRERIVCEQAPYSLLARRPEVEVLPACRRHGVSVMVHQALNGGWLTGKYRRDAEVPSGSRADVWPHGRARFDRERPAVQAKLDAIEKLQPLAAEAGCTTAELAVAFVLRHPAVDVALVGARDTAQLEGLLRGGDLDLDDALLDRLDEIVSPGENLDPEDHTVAYAEPGLTVAARR
jgi:aryl-alcohol dehydrogenase-like predicted oxidoreductase